MKHTQYYICICACALLGLQSRPLAAQSLTFEDAGQPVVSVYDGWEQSPFRTGQLTGNTAIVANPYVDASNPSARVVGIQRSRYGSNTFGVRIPLPSPVALSPKARYVHALIHKPAQGRVMLIGLGKRPERSAQSADTEQCWVFSTKAVGTDAWTDAVFPVKAAEGVELHSLVIVPDCESPHNLAEDFIAYVDNIEINDQAAPRISSEDYAVNFDPAATYTRNDRGIETVGVGEQTISVSNNSSQPRLVYQELTSQQLQAKAGETLQPTFRYKGSWMHGYTYLDFGQDGQFAATVNEDGTPAAGSDLVAYSYCNGHNSAGAEVSDRNILTPPAFTLPADMPIGLYRLRFKVDWNSLDPGGNISEDNHIINNGGGIVDVCLNVHGESVLVKGSSRNGAVTLPNGTPLSDYETPFGKSLIIRLRAADGFVQNGLRLRHGYNLSGDSLVHGMAQYVDEYIPRWRVANNGLFTIPAEYVNGNIEIEGYFIESSAVEPETPEAPEGYKLLWHDEFNQPNGTSPDPTRWVCSVRRGSAWNRFIKDDPSTCFIDNGHLVCRAFRNPDTSTDNVEMISGARESRGLFSFTYGRVDVRLKTTPHVGNFPAAWMMPQPPTDSWPKAGEIDIFESIDAQQRAWHTIHSNWTHNLGYKWNPQSSFEENVSVSDWHVYSLDWTEDALRWYVDGEEVGSYLKSEDEDVLSQGQWPFTHDFYIILNQSVGNGTWARNPDLDFTYETRFDYVRVYQKAESGIVEPVSMQPNVPDRYYDLQGRPVSEPKRGHIYIYKGRKVIF